MVEDVLGETGLPARPHAVLADNSRAHARNATVLTPAPISDIPRHNTQLPYYTSMFEFCCSENSMMGQVGEKMNINIVRLPESFMDLRDPISTIENVSYANTHKGISLWGPCHAKLVHHGSTCRYIHSEIQGAGLYFMKRPSRSTWLPNS